MAPAKKNAKQEVVPEEKAASGEACIQANANSEYKLENLASEIEPIISEMNKAIRRGDSDSLAALYQTLNSIQNLYSRVCFYEDMINLNSPAKSSSSSEEDDEEESDDENVPEKFLERIAEQSGNDPEQALLKKRLDLEDYMKADYCR